MDQKRAGLRAVGRKRHLRIWAAILSFCVLLTALPSPSATLTVFAASEERDISPDDEKIPGGGLNDNVEVTPSKEEEESEESQETDEATAPDKDADGTEEEGGAGESTFPKEEEESEESQKTDETTVPDKDGDDTEEEGGAEESTSPEEEEESEESQDTDETTVPDKDADGTGEEGGAGESTSPEGEDEETTDTGQEEKGADALVQDLLTRIDALPDAEEYLAAEPDVEDEDAYAAWEEKLYEYAKEALSIMEEYETLTEEQQAFISEEALAKLTAWTEIAEIAGESAQVMVAAPHFHDDISFDTPLPADGGELASGNYYLDKDVALKNSIVISSGAKVNICLNGNRLCMSENKNDDCPINVYGQLQVYDCSDEGMVSGTLITGESTVAVRVAKQGMLTLHSGKITGSSTKTVDVEGTFHLYGGTVECTYRYGGFAIDSIGTVIIGGNAAVRREGGSSNSGSAVCNDSNNAVMTLKDNASLFSVSYGVENYGTFNLEGGTITSTSIYGAGIYNTGSSAILNIKGGTVVGEQYGILMSKINSLFGIVYPLSNNFSIYIVNGR